MCDLRLGRLIGVIALAVIFAAGCDTEAPMEPTDAASGRDATLSCTSDEACDDGAFCNGAERCTGGACEPGVAPCAIGCDEAGDRCTDECPDADGDGATDARCGGADCDDSDPGRTPGRPEVCDVANVDEDCDPATYGFRDSDGDGVGDSACCNGDNCGLDCNDGVASIFFGATETCNDLDDDCDGMTDEGLTLTRYYPDVDRDGFGDDSAAVDACAGPAGYTLRPGDCYDLNDAVNPDATGWFTTERGDGSFDYDCSGAASHQYPTAWMGCRSVGLTACEAIGPIGFAEATVPACGTTFTLVTECRFDALMCATRQMAATQGCR